MTNSIADIESADCILISGSNTTEAHPVIAISVRKAVQRGAKLIVIDPRRTEIANQAHIHLQPLPGTDVPIIMAMMHFIVKEKLHNVDFIRRRTEGFSELKRALSEWTPERAAEVCGVDAREICEAARLYASAKAASILYCMGVTQHVDGTANVQALADLAMLCGHLGRPGTGVNPLRGQCNVQGACDMAALPNVLPGYAKLDDSKARSRFEMVWGVRLSDEPGLTVLQMSEAAAEGKLKALYVMGENPALSDPNLNFCKKALKEVEFLVVQDIFLTETAEMADVVLPAVCWAEKDGTFTNTERRVQRIRKSLEPPGDALPDWQIITWLAEKCGAVWQYGSAESIFEEIRRLVPQYRGITWRRIEMEGGLQWPCPSEDHPGTPILHVGRFTRGRGRFVVPKWRGPAELPDDRYPLVLTTGRQLYHFHTRTMTGRVSGLVQMSSEPFVFVNPKDARNAGIRNNGWVRVRSRRGSLKLRVKVTDAVKQGVVFMPFHFSEAPANILTTDARDPISGIPQYKACAVRIERL